MEALERSALRPPPAARRAGGGGARGAGLRGGDGLHLPLRRSRGSSSPSAIASADGVLDEGRYDLLASEARLTSFLAIARGAVPPAHWFRLGRPDDAGRARHRAGVVVGVDVRVPHARAGDAGPRGQPARADVPARGQASDRLRCVPRRAVGDLRVGVQRARPGPDLPVLELRRARARPRARAGRGPRDRAVRDRARRHGRRARGGAELRRARAPGRAGRARLLRGAGLHALAAARGRARRGGARLHGPSPGHDGDRARQRAARRASCASASTASPWWRPPSCSCTSGRRATCR